MASAAAISAIGQPLLAALGRTLRWTAHGLHHYDAVQASGRQPVLAFWHGRIVHATWFFRRRGIVVMTSANFDGEWIATASSSDSDTAPPAGRRPAEGARALVQHPARHARPAVPRPAFTVDGPRGPARSVQPGAVWLARLTGQPRYCLSTSKPLRCWTARQLGPDPDSEALCPCRDRRRDDPFDVPRRRADEERIESTRAWSLEQASLHDVAARAQAIVRGPAD